MQITTKYLASDYLRAQIFKIKNLQQDFLWLQMFHIIICGLAAFLMFYGIFKLWGFAKYFSECSGFSRAFFSAIAGVSLLTVSKYVYDQMFFRATYHPTSIVCSVHTFSLTDSALIDNSEYSERKIYWNKIKTIERDTHNIYFILDRSYILFVPLHAFESEEACKAFLERAMWHVQNNRDTVFVG